MKICVVIPALNEEEGIKHTLERVKKSKENLKEKVSDFNITVVDGGSTDGTVSVAEKFGAKVIVEERKGYGRAYKTGFEAAEGDVIITMDADDSYPAEDIPKLFEYFKEKELDFMTTNRFADIKENAMSSKHRFGNEILNVTSRILFGIGVRDSQSGMWFVKNEALEKMDLTSDGMPFSEEIKIEAFTNPDIKSEEVPITYRERVGEEVISSWEDGMENFFFLIKKRFSKL